MPVNTVQIQKLLGKHTFQQIRLTINEVIDVVNGLPSTVRGDITRQGGVIDGSASGVLPAFDPGQLIIQGEGLLGIGQFLGASDPSVTGHIHVNSTTNSRINLSQNAATGYSYISLQASNTALTPEANNFGFLSATSNTTSKFGMVTLSTANTNYEIDHIYATESFEWGGTSDVSSATRFTLTSGENFNLSPSGGPTAHLAAQLRIDRAINHDQQTSNTAPLLSVRGFTDAYGGVGVNDTPPVRIVIGDRTQVASKKANTYAALDFSANGADTTTEDSVGARISAEINREDDSTLGQSVSSSLEFSVRNGAGSLEKVVKVLPGGTITGTDAKGAVLISNTHYLDMATHRDADADGTLQFNEYQYGQLIVQHTKESGFAKGGILIRGDSDGTGSTGTSQGIPRIGLENPLSTYTAGKKWDIRVEGGSTSSSFELSTHIDDDWTGTPNTQFAVVVQDTKTTFQVGAANPGDALGQGAENGVVVNLEGGYNGEGPQFNFGSNRAQWLADSAGRPSRWSLDSALGTYFRIFPVNSAGFDGKGTGTVSYSDSQIVLKKLSGANTLIGFGDTNPSQALHLLRTYESANLHVESTFSSASPQDDSTARVVATGGGNDWAIVQAVNPNRTYTGRAVGRNYSAGLGSGISFIAHQTNQPVSIKTTTSKEWTSEILPGANIIQLGVDITSDPASGDNLGYAYPMVSIAAEAGYGGGSRDTYFGTNNAGRSKFGGLRIELHNTELGAHPQQDVFRLTAHGFLGIGTPAKASSKSVRSPTAVINPGFQLDLSGHRIAGDNTANTLIAFSLHDDGYNTDKRLWTIGIDNAFTGIGKTDIPFVLGGKSSRLLNQIRGIHNDEDKVRDGLFVAEMRNDANRNQIYQIGIRPEHNTLTIYTPANNGVGTSSPNWDGSYAGRVGIGNTFPRYTLTVNGYNADSSGVAVYGAEAGVRLIDPSPSHAAYTWSSADANEASRDPGGAFTGSVVPERTYHIGARHGSLSIAQNLGPNDTDIHNTSKNITVSVLANTSLISGVSLDASLDNRIYTPENLGEDWYSGGSVGINANSHPLAAGLYVTDVPAGDRDGRRSIFTQKAVTKLGGSPAVGENYGHYPTNVVLGLRPIPNANGAFKPISVVAGSTSNLSSQSSVGSGNIMKRTEGLRRFSEGWIDGAGTGPSAATLSNWNNMGWFDGISVDDAYAVPAPGIGSEFFGTDAMAPGSLTFMGQNSMKVWWERRPQRDNNKANYQNQEYTESHLFGSSNNHVMTIHANTTYQGVHVEKGGIYANNSILAWARILPRGDYSQQLLSADSAAGSAGARAAATCVDSHNILAVEELAVGTFNIELDTAFLPGSNSYAVFVSGTSNIGLQGQVGVSGTFNQLGTTNYNNFETRKRSPEYSTDHDSRTTTPTVGSNVGAGGLTTHNVRVANDTNIIVESRTNYLDRLDGDPKPFTGNALVYEDEIYIIVVGSPQPERFRG